MKIITIALFILFSACFANAQDNRTIILEDLEKDQVARQDVNQTATLKMASRLFGEKDDLTTVILVIPSGSVVDILGSDSTYLHVNYEENEGYIFRRHAQINEAQAAAISVAPPLQEDIVKEEQEAPQQQSRFSYLEDKYGSSMAAKLIAGKIWRGMDAEMVRDSWGKPQKINRVIAGNTVKEEWIYKNTWLYIENDNLVEWGAIR
jgi:hypothetical protein